MSIVDVLEVRYASANPAPFGEPFRFEVTFECLEQLDDDLEWTVTYVGSAEDPTKDQVLEEVSVGPVPLGTSKFVLEAPAPDFAAIPAGDRPRGKRNARAVYGERMWRERSVRRRDLGTEFDRSRITSRNGPDGSER